MLELSLLPTPSSHYVYLASLSPARSVTGNDADIAFYGLYTIKNSFVNTSMHKLLYLHVSIYSMTRKLSGYCYLYCIYDTSKFITSDMRKRA